MHLEMSKKDMLLSASKAVPLCKHFVTIPTCALQRFCAQTHRAVGNPWKYFRWVDTAVGLGYNTVMPNQSDPREALEQHFGFRKFLDAQEEVITSLLEGRDALVVMPTGGGKSLCYQLPALLLDGVTIVVSPLIALMKDQVDALTGKGIPAACLNSTMTLAEQRKCLQAMRAGDLKLVYIAPERFRSRAFRNAIREVKVGLFAVDEAHCLSLWGHDFRPDYFRLGEALQDLGQPQVAAFTATATPEVRADIQSVLRLRNPVEFVTGFARPNLRFLITHTANEARKQARIQKVIQDWKTGILYCATRKRVEALQEWLQSLGVKSVAYHGGLRDAERERAQNRFIKRRCDVVVATNAFGMGIDRPDVRFVMHYEIPGSVEAYYQEAGRAGRDGDTAHCELLFNYADRRIQEFFIDGSNPSRAVIQDLYACLDHAANPEGEIFMSIRDLSTLVGVGSNEMSVSSAITVLDRHGLVERFDVPGKRLRGTRLLQRNLSRRELPIDFEVLAEKERRDRQKLQTMLTLAYGQGCRQRFILDYFGDPDAENCGSCDNCQTENQTEMRGPSKSEALIVQKALSGVARMSIRTPDGWKGRFGRGKIVQCLLGSRSKEILDAGLDRLSTHGILKPHGAAYVNRLMDALLQANLMVVEQGLYPLLTLTPLGAEVMKNRKEFVMQWPEHASAKSLPAKTKGKHRKPRPSPSTTAQIDAGLLQNLQKCRRRLAREFGGLTVEEVCSDQTLASLARHQPRSLQAAFKLSGLNAKRLSKVLPALLHEIHKYQALNATP